MRRLFKITPHSSHICVRIIRAAALNALLIAGELALIAVAGEVYFRVSAPYGFAANPKDFVGHTTPPRFVPNVGLMLDPNSEVRSSNHLDFWTITRTNSLGFLDREPINPERAAESCHIALIGDSFVQADQVAIADKTQVKLEEISDYELPHLDVTTSAFGYPALGQINQLAFYDEYARHLSPKVVALVFVNNDFRNNSNVLTALRNRMDPEHLPMVTAAKGADGALELRPPDPDYEAFRLPPPNRAQTPNDDNNAVKLVRRANAEIVKYSYFARWLGIKVKSMFTENTENAHRSILIWNAELISRQPRYSTLLQGWTPTTYGNMSAPFGKSDLPPVFEDAVAYTKFGLEQFKQRADRDGAKLVILATHSLRGFGDLAFDRLNAMAGELDVSVIDQRDYIVRIGAEPRGANFRHDSHWNEDGHRWAAEALLEWLRDNQDVCGKRS